ncbi:hypothetical protein [Xanthomonas euvesicatoria]|uniref:hypothetical protein n=1 Tax=Xanthomonas euvesicatoria TaxID=456327 RepID=UPI001C43D1AA|nr:hypothetical protein [Xanthomonas euvesicatoria]MBV6778894.1 hypothetical protein [Xanthomonas campestris pv. carissae]
MEWLTELATNFSALLFTKEISDEAHISEVVQAEDIHLIGMTFSADFKLVLAFLHLTDETDVEHYREIASKWTMFHGGHCLLPDARALKFFRSEAKAADLFDPRAWPIPKPFTIWQVQETLTQAIRMYTAVKPEVRQLFFMPQSGALEKWYGRMERAIRGKPSGLPFQNIARPRADEGGFHGYERIENH